MNLLNIVQTMSALAGIVMILMVSKQLKQYLLSLL